MSVIRALIIDIYNIFVSFKKEPISLTCKQTKYGEQTLNVQRK